MELEIVYQDSHLVAINKPHGLLVHRTKLALDADQFALQILRDQLGQKVYPIHRLDRKTAGVLLFGLDETTHKQMQKQFAEGLVHKKYVAIVRGYTEKEGSIDYPLFTDSGKKQEAVTAFSTLAHTEIPLPFGKFQTSRYSLVQVLPKTGRMHQIRKHFAHILHPIIADRPHGCNKQNKLFKGKWGMTTMLLHAQQLNFEHPVHGNTVQIDAPFQEKFRAAAALLNLEQYL